MFFNKQETQFIRIHTINLKKAFQLSYSHYQSIKVKCKFIFCGYASFDLIFFTAAQKFKQD